MYQGFFINLDRSEKRRQALVQQLEGIGAAARYQRIAAIDGRAVADQYPTKLDPGALGLWLTHLKLLEAASQTDAHLHIVEDDAIFAADALSNFDSVLEAADQKFKGWDLIFTDVLASPFDLPFFLAVSRVMKPGEPAARALVDLKPVTFSCTSSFFLNRHSIAKYARLITDQWKLAVPLDIYIRKLVATGALKAYLTVPFLSSVSRDSLHSEIRGGEVNRSLAVLEAYRRTFFQSADFQALDAEFEELIKGATHSPMRMLYLKTLYFCLSEQYVVQ